MAQEQTKRGGGGGDDDDPTASTAAGQERREKLTDETDDLLDEIDDVLEENAEDFVRAYVQKGGPEPPQAAFPHSLTTCAVRRPNCYPLASVAQARSRRVRSCRTERRSSR